MNQTRMEMSAYNLERKPIRQKRIEISIQVVMSNLLYSDENFFHRCKTELPKDLKYVRHYMSFNNMLNIVVESESFPEVAPKFLILNWALEYEKAIAPIKASEERLGKEIGELRAEFRHQATTFQQWLGDTAVRLNNAFERTQQRTFYGGIEWAARNIYSRLKGDTK